MICSAMDLGWKRGHLFVFLTLLNYAVGSEGWIHQTDQSQQDRPVPQRFSRGLQSSLLEAPAAGSNPYEEDLSVVPGASPLMLTASSPKSSGLQTGGNYNPLSAQSSPSTGSLGSYRSLSTSTYGSSGPQMTGLRKLVSTSGLLAQSPSTGKKNVPGSLYARLPASPLGFSQSPSGQSSYSQYTSSSQSSVGTPLKASLQSVPGPGSSSGLSVQPQATFSQYAPVLSFGGKLPLSSQYYQATDRGSSPSQSFQKWQPSVSMTQGFQASSTVLKGSGTSQRDTWSPSKFPSLSSAGGSISSSVQPQGTSSQKVPVPLGAKVSVYSQAAPSGSSLSLSQPSQLQPSGSRYGKPGSSLLDSSRQSASGPSPYRQYTQSSQSRPGTQLPGSSPFVPVNTPTGGSSLQLQGTASLYAPAFFGAKVPVSSQSSQNVAGTPLAGSKPLVTKAGLYTFGSPLQLQGSSSQKAPAAFDAKVPVYSQVVSALSQTPQWKPSTSRWSQGFQASGTAASYSSSPPQGPKDPSRYSGMPIQTPSLSNPYSASYAKLSASPLGVSQSTSGQGTYSQYTSSSQSRAGTLSSPQLLGSSNLYAPLRQSAKVPVNSLASPSRPSQSQPPKLQTFSSWSQGFQTPGTVASQSGSPSQGSKALSRFPTLASAASTNQYASIQEGRGGSSGLSRLSQDPSVPYSPGSPAYAKPGFSGLYVSNSQSVAGTPLADSKQYVPAQTGSTSTGVPLKIHSCNHHDPTVTCQCNKASQRGSPLTGSVASQSSDPPSSSSPQSSKSSIPSSQASSFFGVGLGPDKFSAQAAAGSTSGSQILPGASASVQYPSDSMASSLGSSVQGVLQGRLSGPSSDSTVLSSSYDSIYD